MSFRIPLGKKHLVFDDNQLLSFKQIVLEFMVVEIRTTEDFKKFSDRRQDEYGDDSKRSDTPLRPEIRAERWLQEEGIQWSYRNKKLPCASTVRFPDFMFTFLEYSVLLEIDEHAHRANSVQCEVARLSEIMDSIGGQNLHVVRFNPHCKEWATDFDKQKRVLLDALKSAFSFNHGRQSVAGAHVSYFGYSQRRIQALEVVIK